MTTTKNNEHKNIKVPNKREQNQTCLDSTEREGLRPKGNVPNLRFPEFQGEWEMCKASDLLDFYSTNSLSWDKLEYGTTNIQNLHYGLIHVGLPTMVDIDKDNLPNIIDGNVPKNYELCKEGDVVFADASEDTNEVAKAVEYYNLNGKKVVCGLHTIHGRDNKNKTVVGYKGYAFSSMSFHHQIRRIAQGTKIYSINSKNFSECYVGIPSKEEQQKIADLLRLIDERIATQNKIIDKLQSLIKGMEDNLLDNPLWEKTYLRSFMQFFPTNSLSWEQLSYKEGAIRNLHYGLIHGLQTRGINSASLPMIKNEAIPKQYTLCQVGDVAFADASEDTGEIAKSVEFVDTIEGETICGLHTIHGRDIKNRTVVGFKGFAFNSRYFHNQIKRLAQGTKIFSITANNLSSCYVYLPDFDTQKAIVKLLKAYEENLLVSKRLLEQYEKQKQYLLRQMFI